MGYHDPKQDLEIAALQENFKQQNQLPQPNFRFGIIMEVGVFFIISLVLFSDIGLIRQHSQIKKQTAIRYTNLHYSAIKQAEKRLSMQLNKATNDNINDTNYHKHQQLRQKYQVLFQKCQLMDQDQPRVKKLANRLNQDHQKFNTMGLY